MTQSQLAQEAELSVSHLCLLEKNKREPSINSVEAIAKALDIPLSVLVFLAAENGEVTDLNSEHVDALSQTIMELMKDARR